MSLSRLASQSVTTLKGVGAKVAQKLTQIHVHSVEDLLFHFPLRYQDRTRIYAINDLLPEITATVIGEVENCQIVFGRKRMLICKITDGQQSLTLRFFNFSAAQKNQFSVGKHVKAFGEIKRGKYGYEIVHPEYKVGDLDSLQHVEEAFTPIYPTTEGLKQNTLRSLTDQALERLKTAEIAELIPLADIATQYTLAKAIQTLHRPAPDVSLAELEAGTHPAQQRLAFEELVAHNLSMQKLRQQTQQYPSVAIAPAQTLLNNFIASLPFQPTNAQTRVVHEIQQDMQQPHPMMRLVQGDVGSGKTLVAALAALSALEQGLQVALMAPTEILAEQHAINFANWLSPLGFKVDWLAGKLTGKQKREAQERIANGDSQMVVGTHALFQQDVEFAKLALVIIDEQHRFGVHQRMSLRDKGINSGLYPHQLIMTATPIPRTLAMTAYADLTTSVIDELPPGRTPVKTVVLPDSRRDEVIQRVYQACKQEQRQAYWVCTLIEESEALQCQAAEDTATQLQQALPDLSIGLVHGRMKAGEKQQVMQGFKQGDTDLLVATTVIEVGVDVPNASLMIIENPERLGLAQLHQLRGRVGRGAIASHCLLMYKSPLSKTGQKRLAVMRESTDGFYIAQKDLEIRGPGELLGTRQTGEMSFKVADLLRDSQLISPARKCARKLLQQHQVTEQLIKRWLGDKDKYSQA
ncbi:ATP-dependent DNA helicase RecG [Catenovulum agarivorans DS-2]|uniref:ATP-dependent DNA helicase RecG n=1 Tax=Catenovulum agarivorans DS-2 TaxID=1328313 RepID=W7QLB4_9ALTE|nr:ATP-dependent DNA helicase RecG [Catenovulum agarivorans]EWH08928.1 ATP-dependent DNA helicase RecG [Catenovulum agarivorans DS-2]